MPLGSFEPLPFRHGCAATLSPFHGDSFWLVLPPACPERGGGCECNEQTEGLYRGCSCLRQPLSQTFGLPAPRPGSLLDCASTNYKPALKGEVDASATSRRRGCIGAALIYGNPSVNPPCGVLPAPRPGSLLGAILYAKIYELTPRLEQGRLTHCRS